MQIEKFFLQEKPPLEDKYFFFYSARNANGYLSNFSKHKFTENTKTFHSVEQYMHYHKAILFGDEEIAQQIMDAKTPFATKTLGRKVRKFNAVMWDANKKQIVKRGVMLKFEQNSDIRRHLILTRPKLLVEAANKDRIWGIGFDSSEALENIDNWGENLLGQILTEAREELSATATAATAT